MRPDCISDIACYMNPQQTQNICITFVQRRPNVFDAGPTLYKCYTNVLCLLDQPWRVYTLTGSFRLTVPHGVGGGPGAVAEAACWDSHISRVRTPLWPLSLKKKMFLIRAIVKIQYCGEPPWPEGSVLGLKPPGLEIRILCLGNVISSISPSSWGSPGPV